MQIIQIFDFFQPLKVDYEVIRWLITVTSVFVIVYHFFSCFWYQLKTIAILVSIN